MVTRKKSKEWHSGALPLALALFEPLLQLGRFLPGVRPHKRCEREGERKGKRQNVQKF